MDISNLRRFKMKVAKIKQKKHLEQDVKILNIYKRLNARYERKHGGEVVVRSESLLEFFKQNGPRPE